MHNVWLGIAAISMFSVENSNKNDKKRLVSVRTFMTGIPVPKPSDSSHKSYIEKGVGLPIPLNCEGQT